MDAQLKRKWVKALRSGKYKQGTGSLLNDKGRFCCLGVLCDIQGAEWVSPKSQFRTSLDPVINGKLACASDMEFVRPSRAGDLPRRKQEKLAELNDDGKSFPEIAEYIEREL